MRYAIGLAAASFFATLAIPAASWAADAPPEIRQVRVSGNVSREVLDVRAAHLARAALEGEQVDTLSREELVSLFVLMSLHQSKRQPS
jgi:hypothetical protein